MLPQQYLTFLILAPAAALSSFLVGAHSWRHRHCKGALTFAIFMWLSSLWALSDAFELGTASPEATILWSRVSYLFISTTPVAWFVFVFQFYERDRWINLITIELLLVIPAITNLFLWIPTYHRLIWAQYQIIAVGNFVSLSVVEYGPWFWVLAAYQYLLIAIAAIMVVRHIVQSSLAYRRQSVWLLIAAVFPIGFNLVYVFRLFPWLSRDFTTVAFAFAGIALATAIFRYQLFKLTPIARDYIIDQIEDGYVITDNRDLVVDINPAAEEIFRVTDSEVLGKKITELLPEWSQVSEDNDSLIQFTTKMEHEDRLTHYDVKVTRLNPIRHRMSGKIIILRDITERVRLLEEVQQLAMIDDLTQVYNRRHFFSLADSGLKLAMRYQRPFSIIILDIDHFKEINDKYGHLAGDAILRGFVQLALKILRESDVFARYGGEEFIIMLPETGEKEALIAAERLRSTVNSMPIAAGNDEIAITISLGVASASAIKPPVTLEKLVDRADRALYQAKQLGRNQVLAYHPESPDL